MIYWYVIILYTTNNYKGPTSKVMYSKIIKFIFHKICFIGLYALFINKLYSSNGIFHLMLFKTLSLGPIFPPKKGSNDILEVNLWDTRND